MDITKECCHRLFQYAPDAILQINSSNVITLANPKAARLTGYSASELLGKNIVELFSKKELLRKPLRKDLLMKGEPVAMERNLLRKDGSTVSVEMNTVLAPEGVIWSFVRDISGLLHERKALLEIEKRYEVAFKTSPDSVAITDMNGTFVEVNNGFCEMFGWSVLEVLGQTSIDLGFWVDLNEREQMFEHIRRDGYVINFEAKMRRKDGKVLHVLASFTKMNLNGIPHNLSLIRDISDRKQMENALREAKLKAEESDRLKTTFLANISHEIRTPMNAILGFSGILISDFEEIGDQFSEQNDYVQIIQQRGSDLIGIIDDILEMSSIEIGETQFNSNDGQLSCMLDALEKKIQPLKAAKKDAIKWICKPIDEVNDISFHTDWDKLERILFVLLSNALKYTDSGLIRYDCWKKGDKYEFIVEDTGIGIAREHQIKIFEPFCRIEGDEAIKRGGSGLGLAICKAYVEGLGGEISVDSIQGKGSTFHFWIPC